MATTPPATARLPTPTDPVDLEADPAAYQKTHPGRALDQTGGVKKRAAELLGINYCSLRHRLQKYGLNDGDDDEAPPAAIGLIGVTKSPPDASSREIVASPRPSSSSGKRPEQQRPWYTLCSLPLRVVDK